MSLRSSLSSLRKLKSPEGNKRASSVGILASIDAILDRESTANSIDDSLDDESDDCESINGDIVPPPPNAELAKQLMSPPKPSPGVLKRKSTGRMRRTKLLKDSKKTSSSMSAIDSLLLSSEDDDESLLLSPPITPGGTKKRKSKKKNMLQALQESADTLPPFQFEGEEGEGEETKKSSPRTMRRASMGALTTTSSSSGAVAADDTMESPSLRGRRKTLSSSLHSDMPSSIRKTRSTKVETSSRRGKRTGDGETSSRRARRSIDSSKSKKGDGSSSRRSKRTVDGNEDDDAEVASSLRSSRKSGMSGEMVSSIRRERSSLKASSASTSSGSVKSSTKKKKTKKTSTTKKSKRRSAESYGSTATSKTADLDESWNSLREESQRSGLSEESTQEEFAHEEGEYDLKEESEEEEEEEIQNEFELILEEEEEREYELPLPDDDNAVESMFNDSFHYMGKDQGQSSTSSLDLSDDDDDEAQIVEQKKKELPRFLGHASLGAIDYNPFEVSEDEDEALLQDADDDNNDELKEETVARPPSSNRRSSVRDSGTSKRGLSCGPIKARGREEERSHSKRGFSVSPTREVNLEAMMGFQRPLLSCMKGSRMKLLSVKLKNPHVYFNECLVITPIIPTYELAAKKSDLWFKQKDFDKILNRSMAIALRVKEGKKTRKCTRGLEHFLKDKEERYAAWNAVLVEQEIQKLRGSHSDEKISELYLAASTTCRTEAQERAQEDYDAIVKYILED